MCFIPTRRGAWGKVRAPRAGQGGAKEITCPPLPFAPPVYFCAAFSTTPYGWQQDFHHDQTRSGGRRPCREDPGHDHGERFPRGFTEVHPALPQGGGGLLRSAQGAPLLW